MALSINITSQSVEYSTGGSIPTTQNLILNPGKYLIQYPNYVSYKLTYYINNGSTTVNWLDIAGPYVIDEQEIDLSHSNIGVYVDLRNLEIIESGSFTGSIYFMLIGTDSNGFSDVLSEVEHTVNLLVNTQLTIEPDKYIYNLRYLKSTNTFSGDTLITLLNNAGAENCSIQLTQAAQYFAIADASFSTSTNIIAGADLAQLSTVTSNPLGILAVLKNSAGDSIANFSLKVTILENDEITANISTAEFELVKSKSEVKTQKFNLSNPSGKSFSITAPSFVTVSPSSGNTSAEITISTVNSSTLNIGDYSGDIVITFDSTKTIVIPITLSVINFFSSQLSSDFNFCLDKKLMKFYKIDKAGVFVRALLTITFRTPTETKTVERSYVLPYFEGKAEMDIGAKIQTYFLKYIKNILAEANVSQYFNQKVWYYPVSVTGTVEELDADYNIKNSETLTEIKFFAGKKPLGYPVLTNNLVRRRSADSKVIFSFISGVTNINDFGANFTSYAVVPDKVAVALKTEIADQLFTWPSVKQFNIGVNPIKIITLPNNNQTVNVAFYNSNLVPDWLTITGDFKISNDFTYTISRNVISGNEEKFDTDKTKNLTINSGFILRTELPVLEELAESKLIFLEIAGKYYKGILTTNKIGKEDSTEELISRDLEFLITEA